MTNPLATLEADLGALRDEWGGARPAFGPGAPFDAAGASVVDPASMSDTGLVRVLQAAAQLRRDAEAVLARVAAEIGARSDSGFGAEGLAKQQGHRNAAQFIATVTGEAVADAGKLLRVGGAVRPRSSFTGEALRSRHPAVADSLDRGAIALDAADAICSMLERIAPRTSLRQAEAYEAELVRFAAGTSHALVLRAVRHSEARLDPDGVEPRDDVLREQRSLTITEEAAGMVRITARLDPVSAAPVKAAVEAIVTEALRRRSGRADGADGADDLTVLSRGAVPATR